MYRKQKSATGRRLCLFSINHVLIQVGFYNTEIWRAKGGRNGNYYLLGLLSNSCGKFLDFSVVSKGLESST